ncbi:esterase [Flavobacteriaceae bacterium AU392]|nr:esterase [Flavobacteriaceae bacterium]RKM84652.1 esterase [Flavobacteriaceae bacterium AU392]
MKTKLTTLLLFLCIVSNAQTIYEEFKSNKLGVSRQIKIQLPRNYETNTDKSYPLFIVLDGDYLFEVVAGNVDYYSYWEDMPESIVVGINQIDSRDTDLYYSDQNYFPAETGIDFFEFIGMELIPHINKTYRTENFKIAVGHGETANFINYYLFKDNPLFQAYIALSPYFAEGMIENIPEQLKQLEAKKFYYLATASNDRKSIKEDSENLNASLSSIDETKLSYSFDNFEGTTHYSMPAHGIPKALENMFYVYQPISKDEYKETMLTYEGSPVEYLNEKYKTIFDLFGIEKQVLINDFQAVASAIEKKEIYDAYEELSKIARKHYPGTLLGTYYLARYQEETGSPKKAMRTYKSAYIMDEIAGITKDFMLEKAEEIKADFGY